MTLKVTIIDLNEKLPPKDLLVKFNEKEYNILIGLEWNPEEYEVCWNHLAECCQQQHKIFSEYSEGSIYGFFKVGY